MQSLPCVGVKAELEAPVYYVLAKSLLLPEITRVMFLLQQHLVNSTTLHYRLVLLLTSNQQ